MVAAAVDGAVRAAPASGSRLPAAIAACAGGPLAVAVLRPRSKKRDVVLFALQMWAFTVVHEMPYDDPERLRARLRTRYPIVLDRAIGARPPAQRAAAAGPRPLPAASRRSTASSPGSTGSGSSSPTWR